MLISIAVDHQTADLATRERFHLGADQVERLYSAGQSDGIAEIAHLATCNRSEVYAWCPAATMQTSTQLLWQLAARWLDDDSEIEALLNAGVIRAGDAVARHVARVAAGLESQALADGQILGQLRDAHRHASSFAPNGSVIDRMMQMALRAGKRVHAGTPFHRGVNSVGALAVLEAARILGSLELKRVVLVGSGKTNECAARQLLRLGAKHVTLLNRTPERAAVLAAEFGYESLPFETLHDCIARSDVAIVATSASDPIVSADLLNDLRSMQTERTRALLIMDLAMPRNVDMRAADVAGVTLMNLDSLHPALTATEVARRSAIPAAEAIVNSEVDEFLAWLTVSDARNAIRPLHDAIIEVCRKEIAFVLDDSTADRVSRRIAAKIMARPMLTMREAVERGESLDGFSAHFQKLFTT